MLRPLYLEGEVTTIIWADPHAHLELLHRPSSSGVPPHIRQLSVPKQKENVDVKTLLQKAVSPAEGNEHWRVELPSLARLSKWNVPRPKIQQVIGVIGYLGPQLKGTPTIQIEILFIDGNPYPMRSDPA